MTGRWQGPGPAGGGERGARPEPAGPEGTRSPGASPNVEVDPADLVVAVGDQLAAGGRFAGLVATGRAGGTTTLQALVVRAKDVGVVSATLPRGADHFPSLSPSVPAADWYEREIHDLFGVVADGHPALDPLVLPLPDGSPRPRPGTVEPQGLERLCPDTTPLPAEVAGEGLFTIPYGPVRSGIFETIEYLVETFGEDIPALRTRVHYKHRGIDRRFGALGVDDAVLLAERVEGTASVAHATAYCEAVEQLAGVTVPRPGQLLRVAHAELERIVNHLDSMVRHCEGAGQAVANARLSTHKERLMRLRSRLCGHRFGRGVVVPGGVSGPPAWPVDAVLDDLAQVERALLSDVGALMVTPSFLDRLRGTGPLPARAVAGHGAVGPVGRASGLPGDVRADRPTGAYRSLGFEVALAEEGDALARQHVRVTEVRQSFHLLRQALDELGEELPALRALPGGHGGGHGGVPDGGAGGAPGDAGGWRVPTVPADGLAVGSVEAPQGELLYLVEVAGGRLARVKPRCPSFHNLALFPAAFQGDIFTDFVFIEASFGLSFAGAAG